MNMQKRFCNVWRVQYLSQRKRFVRIGQNTKTCMTDGLSWPIAQINWPMLLCIINLGEVLQHIRRNVVGRACSKVPFPYFHWMLCGIVSEVSWLRARRCWWPLLLLRKCCWCLRFVGALVRVVSVHSTYGTRVLTMSSTSTYRNVVSSTTATTTFAPMGIIMIVGLLYCRSDCCCWVLNIRLSLMLVSEACLIVE